MKMARFKKILLLMIIILSATINPAAEAKDNGPTATVIVNNMQLYYAKVNDYSAAFVQTTAHKLFSGKLQRSYGKVNFKNGGLMRWEYARPAQKLFVYDGATLWVYEPEVPQIFKAKADADRLRKGLAFLTGEGKIRDSYRVKKVTASKFGFTKGYVLKLYPKQKNSPFKHVELYVNSTNYRVERSVVVDHDGNRNRLDFSSVKTNTSPPAAMFSFTPPAGVPIIDGMPK